MWKDLICNLFVYEQNTWYQRKMWINVCCSYLTFELIDWLSCKDIQQNFSKRKLCLRMFFLFIYFKGYLFSFESQSDREKDGERSSNASPSLGLEGWAKSPGTLSGSTMGGRNPVPWNTLCCFSAVCLSRDLDQISGVPESDSSLGKTSIPWHYATCCAISENFTSRGKIWSDDDISKRPVVSCVEYWSEHR